MFARPALFLAVSVITATAGCGEQAADLIFPVSDEVTLGREFVTEIEAEATLHADAEVQAYIDDLGRRVLASVSPAPPAELEWTFKVIDDDETVNAFAAPGGHIYFYTGLLLLADNESEVAGVMGHEIAHVTERHIAQRLVAMYGMATVTAMVLGDSTGTISALVANLAQTGALLSYSRAHETNADEVGIEYVIDAGFSPQGFVTFFEKLDDMQTLSLPDFLSTHPAPDNRIEHIEEILSGRADLPTETTSDAFVEMQSRL